MSDRITIFGVDYLVLAVSDDGFYSTPLPLQPVAKRRVLWHEWRVTKVQDIHTPDDAIKEYVADAEDMRRINQEGH